MKRSNCFIIFFTLIITMIAYLSANENRMVFEHINTSDGLTNNGIQSLYQDSKGYLWVGTMDGLNKYDGYTFTTYRHDPQDSSSLSQNHVFSIFEDSFGNLWISTEDGLNRYNRGTDNFTIYRYDYSPTSNPMVDRYKNTIISIFESTDSTLWMGTVFKGLAKFDRSSGSFSFSTYKSGKGFAQNAVFQIIEDNTNKNRLWLSLWDNGFASYDIKKDAFTVYHNDPHNKNSISSTNVRQIIPDKNGAIWIATEGGGINKFDPATNQFLHYKNDPQNPQSLGNDNVWSFFENPDEPEVLWVGTRGSGLNRFDKKTGQFSAYKADVNDPTSLSNNSIWTMFKDISGVMWIGTLGGLDKIDPGRVPFHQYRKTTGKSPGLNSNQVYAIEQSTSNPDIFWIGTYQGGLNKFNRKTNTFSYYKHNPLDAGSISGNNIRSIYEDPDEAGEVLWLDVATSGLNRFDIKNNHFKNYSYIADDPHSISNNTIRQIYKTRDGMLWLTTANGLNKFDRKKETFTRYLRQDTTYNNFIQNMLKTLSTKRTPLAAILKVKNYADSSRQFILSQKTKVLLVGLGEAISNMVDYGWLEDDHGKKLWQQISDKSRHAGGDVKNKLQVFTMTLDAGSYKLRYISDDSHSYGNWNAAAPTVPEWWGIQVFKINDQQYNQVLQNIDKFIKLPSIASSNTTVILEDSYGMLWIGTNQDGGLSKLDRKTGRFTNYFHKRSDLTSLSNNTITSLHEDNNGVLWIGTMDGLNKYVPKTDSFKNYFRKDGLPGNQVINILEDLNGNLWLATDNGISKFNPADEAQNGYLTFINYSVPDGLPFDRYNMGAMLRSAKGEMFFGGSAGFVSFFPGKSNPVPPRTILSKFFIFNKGVTAGENSPLHKHISETKSIELPYDLNVFAFEFTGLHFTRPEKNKYLYKLEGFDKDWIDGSRRYAPYTNLDPARYTFRVKSSNSDGVWDQNGVTLKINILPPWWRTTAAYIGFGLFILAFGFGLDRLQRRRMMAKTKERMKIQAAEHRAEAAELQACVIQAENDRKTRELEEARQLQLAMLPNDLPNVPNLDIAVYMQTATEVGGDYYDFSVMPDGSLNIVIGDATGHGMKAGIMVSSMKSIFTTNSPKMDIDSFFATANRGIKSMALKHMLMSFTMLNINKNKVRLINAGMPPVFLYHKSLGSVEEITEHGMPIGAMTLSQYKANERVLAKGDALLLLSDGMPELQNANKEMYGYKRIRRGFEAVAGKAPQEIINYFKNESAAWANDKGPDDDVTFVVIRLKS